MSDKAFVLCPGCSKTFQVSPKTIGKRMKCPSCDTSFTAVRFDAEPDPTDDLPGPRSRRLLIGSGVAAVLAFSLIGAGMIAMQLRGPKMSQESSAVTSRPKSDIADLVERIEPAVILLRVKGTEGDCLGSGFVVNPNGIAVTNYHVVEGATDCVATFVDGHEEKVNGCLFHDKDLDIAIIQLDHQRTYASITLATELPRKGEMTLAFGAPNGLEFTTTQGIVSAIREEGRTLIQTSTPISSGNSGGPLVDSAGKVVGVNTFTLKSGQNLNFAVSALEVAKCLEKLAKAPGPFPTGSSPAAMKPVATLSPQAQAFIQAAKDEMAVREKSLSEMASKLDSLRAEVNARIIAIDKKGEADARSRLFKHIDSINEVASKPLSLPRLSPNRLREGDVGIFDAVFIDVIQVISKDEGVCLASSGRSTFKLHNIDLTNIIDSAHVRLSPQLIFLVKGTETYRTVAGSTNTVFVVTAVGDLSDLHASLEKFKITDPTIPALTESELAQQKANQAEKDRQEMEIAQAKAKVIAEAVEEHRKKREAEQNAKLQKEQEQKEAKAAAKLALAKTFLEKKDTAAAKKWCQQVQREFPGTAAATEAAALLETLSK